MTKFLWFFNDLMSDQYSFLLVSIVHSPNFFDYSSKAAKNDFCMFSLTSLTKIAKQDHCRWIGGLTL
jgi:hypothetical protein